jgi:chloramphenicol-sensitive protein RarD
VSVVSKGRAGFAGAAVAKAPAGSRLGLWYGLGCYIVWGFIPLYFHALSEVSPWIILCHRILWSSLFLAVVVSVRREWKFILPVLRTRRNVVLLVAGSLLIAANWLIFIYAVATKQALEASFGYFINPVFSIALGMIFLKERLRGWQWLAVFIAATAVGNLALRETSLPWIAISLAGTFGSYGLVRKKVNINSLHGLLVETTILLPAGLIILFALPHAKTSPANLGLLSLSGLVTAIPLLMFGAALRLLKLSTLGFLQYVGPTLQFLVALLIFHEPLDRAKLASFVLTWIAIAVYVADSIFARRPPSVADEPD